MTEAPLHLVKLCVGAASIGDLEAWIERSVRERGEQVHTTRMVPKREADLLPHGSLYWVIKGQLQCRQRLLAVRPFTDAGGIRRCHLVLEPQVRPVVPRPWRPFQGWRYLLPEDAPADVAAGAVEDGELPAALRAQLRALCLL